VARFFDGMEMAGPGLRPLDQWWGSGLATTGDPGLSCYCGIARRPEPSHRFVIDNSTLA
jgi:hypothetical protein